MPRVHKVNKARKDYPEQGIQKGDTYYWWKFRYGGKRMSKDYPKRQQLTNSGFLIQVYGIEDSYQQYETFEGLQEHIEDVCSQIEDLLSEVQDSLDAMPYHLQESSPTGELLTQRIESLEEWRSELESVDFDVDEELTGEELEEAKQAVLDEVTAISFQG